MYRVLVPAVLALAACATPTPVKVAREEVDRATAQRFDDDREVLEAQAAAAGEDGPPLGFVGGRLRWNTRPRISPDRRAAEVGEELPAGTPVWIAPRPSAGWRQVWRPGLWTSWVEDGEVEKITRAAADGGEAKQPGAR